LSIAEQGRKIKNSGKGTYRGSISKRGKKKNNRGRGGHVITFSQGGLDVREFESVPDLAGPESVSKRPRRGDRFVRREIQRSQKPTRRFSSKKSHRGEKKYTGGKVTAELFKNDSFSLEENRKKRTPRQVSLIRDGFEVNGDNTVA